MIKLELNKIESQKTDGAVLRSRAEYYENGEKNSAYFFNLEKYKSKAKVMTKIKKENGTTITKPRKVLAEQQMFYKSLYTSDPTIKFQLDIQPTKKLDLNMQEKLERPLQIEELGVTLKQSRRNRTPGPCGISSDFYMMFWLRIKHHMYDAFMECFEVKRIFPSGRNGIISLIPKQNRDLTALKNWRPIILLSTDYKILAKAIANRLKGTLGNLIHEDQTGFMAGRNITQNIRGVADMIEYVNKRKLNILILSIDFEKAFDRVEYTSLLEAFKWMGYGPQICQWIQILFQDFALCTLNNGFSSERFTPTRGLFQGNPISPYGFLIIIETLAELLRQNPRIQGVKIGHTRKLLSMFADDMDIFALDKETEWLEIRATIESFHKISGLKVNYDKSSVLRVGNKTNAKYYSMNQLKWSSGSIKVLGVWIGENSQESVKENLEPLLCKVENILNAWKNRKLTIIGKILIINTLMGSLFTYSLSVLRRPVLEMFEKLHKSFKLFIWQGTKSKIPIKILQGNKFNDGLGLVNMIQKDHALKIQWVHRLLKMDHNNITKIIAYDLMENPIKDLIWQTQLHVEDVKTLSKAENFWIDVLTSWCHLNYLEEMTSKSQVLSQVIWFNSNIKIDNKPIFYKNWYKAGITILQDLYNINGSFKQVGEIEKDYKIKVCFTELEGIKAALPDLWKFWLEDRQVGKPEHSNIEILISLKSATGWAYRSLNQDKNLLSLVTLRWNQIELPTLTVEQLNRAIRDLYKITISVKLRAFQYRLLL